MRKNLGKWLIICFFAALIVEATVMNYGFYYSLFSEKEISWNEAEAANIINTKDGLVREKDDTQTHAGIIFKNLNTKIRSVYIDVVFAESAKGKLQYRKNVYGGYLPIFDKSGEEADFLVSFNDDNSNAIFSLKSVKHLSHTKYFPLFPLGRVSELTILWENENVAVKDIILNKTIPIKISIMRLALMFLAFHLVFAVKTSEYRNKIKSFLFDLTYDEKSVFQKRIFIIAILAAVLFCLFTSWSAYRFSNLQDQYNYYMPKAFLSGEVSLPIEPSQELLDIEQPFDWNARLKANAAFWWDHVFYNGKYYSYYGVVPVLTMFLPYFALSGGETLPTSFAVFVFSALACVFMMLLWKEIVTRHFNKIPYFLFLLSALTFTAVSGIFLIQRRPMYYEIAEASALFFSVLGLFLLIMAMKDKISIKLLFFACLALALAVGCRPTAIFSSLFVPILLWKDFIQSRNKIAIIVSIAIPYLSVGIPMALYNYARFDSFSDFGILYSLTVSNNIIYQDLNFIGKTIRQFNCFWQYVFTPLQYSAQFPFVQINHGGIPYNGYIINYGAYGLINIPIMFYLLNFMRTDSILKNSNPSIRKLFLLSFALSIVQIFSVSYVSGVHHRYSVDFMWLLAIPALICAYCVYENAGKAEKKLHLKLIYIIQGVSILISLFLSLTGEANNCISPVFYYIQRAFSLG
jgi:hypothetical protein